MAILDILKTKDGEEKKGDAKAKKAGTKATAAPAPARNGRVVISDVIKRPRVTEKATVQIEKGVYVFEVDPRANKTEVKKAVQELFKVTPVRINITKMPAKKYSSYRMKSGTSGGGKKAYVYVKEGDKIEVI